MKYTFIVVLWTIVAAPIVAAIVSLPFILFGAGVSMIFNLTWPVIDIPQNVAFGLFLAWIGLLIIAFAISFIQGEAPFD